jgi:hypothetical protein
MLIGLLVTGLIAFVIDQTLLGYPPSEPGIRALNRREQALIAAVADTLFPEGGSISLSGSQAGLVHYFDASYVELPRNKRMLLSLLFVFTEYAPWIFGPERGRFSRLSPAARARAMNAMAESPIYFRRICFLSMRGILTMGYLANDQVARQIGAAPDLDPFTRLQAKSA